MHGHYHQEDISRILDPSYASSSSSSTAPYRHHSKHTQYHDPDYHYFPSSSSHSPKSKKQKRNSLEGRPSWELGQGQGLEQTEEWGVYYNDGAEDDEFPSSSFPTYHVSPRRRRRENTVASTATYSSSLAPPSTSSSYTSTTTSSSGPSTPRSYNATLSDSDLPHSHSHHHHHHHKLTKCLWPEHVHPFSSTDDFRDEEEENISVPASTKDKSHSESHSESHSQTTCGEAMKKQWYAMSLSVRFGVFRAQRRVKEALKR